MKTLTKSTKSVKEAEIDRKWHFFDVSDKVLGRTTTNISRLLQGKHKVNYVPYLDMGDHVVIINAKKIRVTGKKLDDKTYVRYSGYPGGLKKEKLSTLLDKKPEEVVRHAVSGMLPKNKLRKVRLSRLHIYPDDKHPYEEKFKS